MSEDYKRVRMIDVERVPGLTQETLLRALRGAKEVPLPDDARVRRLDIDLTDRSVTLEVESETYDMVHLGEEIPRQAVT